MLVFKPDFLPRDSGGGPGDASDGVSAFTDERHGNISLNNEQHLFTLTEKGEIVRKKVRKFWKNGSIVRFVTLNLRED